MHTEPVGLEGPTTQDNIHLETLLRKAFQASQEPSTIKPWTLQNQSSCSICEIA